jgi:hypothetical protein
MLELCAAVAVGHAVGAAVGAACAAAGLVLLAYGACASERAAAAVGAAGPDAGATLTARLLPHQVAKPPVPPHAAWPVANALLACSLLLLAVRAASTDPRGAAAGAFPRACGSAHGCARVAAAEPHRAGGEWPLRLATTADGAAAAVHAWLRRSLGPRSEVLYDGPAISADGAPPGARLIHARVVSPLWGVTGVPLLWAWRDAATQSPSAKAAAQECRNPYVRHQCIHPPRLPPRRLVGTHLLPR